MEALRGGGASACGPADQLTTAGTSSAAAAVQRPAPRARSPPCNACGARNWRGAHGVAPKPSHAGQRGRTPGGRRFFAASSSRRQGCGAHRSLPCGPRQGPPRRGWRCCPARARARAGQWRVPGGAAGREVPAPRAGARPGAPPAGRADCKSAARHKRLGGAGGASRTNQGSGPPCGARRAVPLPRPPGRRRAAAHPGPFVTCHNARVCAPPPLFGPLTDPGAAQPFAAAPGPACSRRPEGLAAPPAAARGAAGTVWRGRPQWRGLREVRAAFERCTRRRRLRGKPHCLGLPISGCAAPSRR
jgi:hypothetical protein